MEPLLLITAILSSILFILSGLRHLTDEGYSTEWTLIKTVLILAAAVMSWMGFITISVF